jgi:hypothetical protein
MNFRLALGGLLVAGLSAGACGSNGPVDVPASVMSTSFSPTTATTASGAPAAELWWRHRINGGQPTSIVMFGSAGTVTFGDRTTRVTAGGTHRETTFASSLTLDAAGTTLTSNATSTTTDTFMVGPPAALVSESLHTEELVSGGGTADREVTQTLKTPAMPLVDFADRADLDQLPVGHIDEATVTTVVTGSVTTTSGGRTQTLPVSGTTSDHEIWTITEQVPSMTVLGNTYTRVVKAELKTDSTDMSTLSMTSVTATAWFAAGIGIIKELQNDSNLSIPITHELVDTNLGLP